MAEHGPLSGQNIGGKYLLGNLLGQGGFGVVYQAEHVFLKRSQAVKILLEQHFHRPKFRDRFLREAQTLALLDHPHIVHIDDFGMDGNRAYLVMPYVSGGTLADRLRGGPLDLPTTTVYLEQICKALGFAHTQGVVHLDLKPLNLLIHRDGQLLLSDFGLAHLLSAGAIEGGTSLQFGSPLYMAPEHFAGNPGQGSDLYALGVILYQMLTGRVPFNGTSPVIIMRKHLTEQPPLLRTIRPELPEAVEKVMRKALAKQPDERYGSAWELLVDFKKVLVGGAELPRFAQSPLDSTQAVSQPLATLQPTIPVFSRDTPFAPDHSLSVTGSMPSGSRREPAIVTPSPALSTSLGDMPSGKQRRGLRVALIVLAAVLTLALVGGAGAYGLALVVRSPSIAVTTTSGDEATVHLNAASFNPTSVVVSRGKNLRVVDDAEILQVLANGSWENNMPTPMREPGAPLVNNVQISSGSVELGPFSASGTFHIFCLLHAGMNLTVFVS